MEVVHILKHECLHWVEILLKNGLILNKPSSFHFRLITFWRIARFCIIRMRVQMLILLIMVCIMQNCIFFQVFLFEDLAIFWEEIAILVLVVHFLLFWQKYVFWPKIFFDMSKIQQIENKFNENLHADKGYERPEKVLSLKCDHKKSKHYKLLNDKCYIGQVINTSGNFSVTLIIFGIEYS